MADKIKKAYMSSRTRADAPPPPLQMAATPYFPLFCLNTCNTTWLRYPQITKIWKV